jgi:AcrR family transcriptional regulator
LLKAAKEVFAKLGFNGATTKMIAKKADMNESLIGRYFQGKYGLLLTLIQKLIVEVKAMDLPYAPPYSPAIDPLLNAAQIIYDKLKK